MASKTLHTSSDLTLIHNSITRAIELIDDNKALASIHLDENKGIYIDKYGTIVFEVNGGLNLIKGGDWKDYFEILSKFISNLDIYFQLEYWMLDLKYDALDDLFWGTFGIRYKKAE